MRSNPCIIGVKIPFAPNILACSYGENNLFLQNGCSAVLFEVKSLIIKILDKQTKLLYSLKVKYI